MKLSKPILGLIAALFIAVPCVTLMARHGGGRWGGGHHRGYRRHHGHYYGDSGIGLGVGLIGGMAVGSAIASSETTAPSSSILRDDIITLDRKISANASDIKVLEVKINEQLRRIDELGERVADLEAGMRK